DAGHVQRPTRKAVPPHLTLAHRVEEELKIPSGARQGAQQVISQHRRAQERLRWRSICHHSNMRRTGVLHHFAAPSVYSSFDDRFLFCAGGPNLRVEELISSLVACKQDQAPDEVCKEASNQNHDEDRQSLPKLRGTVLKRECFDRITRGQAICEASAHDT